MEAFSSFASYATQSFVPHVLYNVSSMEEYTTVFRVSCNFVQDAMKHGVNVSLLTAVVFILSVVTAFTIVAVYVWSQFTAKSPKYVLHHTSSDTNVILVQFSPAKLILMNAGLLFSLLAIVIFCIYLSIATIQIGRMDDIIFRTFTKYFVGFFHTFFSMMTRLFVLPSNMNRDLNVHLSKTSHILDETIEKFYNKTFRVSENVFIRARMLDTNIFKLYELSLYESVWVKEVQARIFILKTLFRQVNERTSILGDERDAVETILTEINGTLADVGRYVTQFSGLKKNHSPILWKQLHSTVSNLVMQTELSLRNWKTKDIFDLTVYTNELRRYGLDFIEAISHIITTGVFKSEYSSVLAKYRGLLVRMKSQSKFAANRTLDFQQSLIALIVVSLSLGFPIGVGALYGLYATNAYNHFRSKGFIRNVASNNGAIILEAGVYIASIFIWLYWLLVLIFFFMALHSANTCATIENFDQKSAFLTLMTISDREFWANNTLATCEKEMQVVKSHYITSFKKLLKQPVIDIPTYLNEENLKLFLENIPRMNEKAMQDVVDIFIIRENATTTQKIENLKHLRRKFLEIEDKISHILMHLKTFDAQTKEAYRIILEHTSNLRKHSEVRLRLYKTIYRNMLSSFEPFYQVIIEMATQFNSYLANDAYDFITNTLTSLIKKDIEGLKFKLKYMIEVQSFNRNVCRAFEVINNGMKHFFCKRYLDPMSTIWLSIGGIAVSLLTAVVLGVPTAGVLRLQKDMSYAKSTTKDAQTLYKKERLQEMVYSKAIALIALERSNSSVSMRSTTTTKN